MDLKNFFNILLLAVSLTTILVTLVSYIIFKLRLGANKNNQLKDPLEGSFFRRFAPKIKEEHLRLKEQMKTESGKVVSFKVKFISLFVFLVVIVSGLFLFEDYFSYRKKLSDRVLAASSFRELVKNGHLKSYEFIPRSEDVSIEMRISKNSLDQRAYLIEVMKDQKFCLVSTRRAREFSPGAHKSALKMWTQFFKRNDLRYSLNNNIVDSDSCISIYPHIHSVSRSQAQRIKEQKNMFLITGGLGIVDGLGGEVETSLHQEMLKKNIEQEATPNPILIASETEYLWDIDGGSFLPWLATDSKFSYVLSEKASILASDYNGKIVRTGSNVHARLIQSENFSWSALDPIEHIYSDLVFLNIFAKMKNIPVFKASNFKKSGSAVSFLYRQNKAFDNIEDTLDLFGPLNSKWTLFTNNLNYEGVERKSSSYEVAVLTSLEHNFEKLENREAFNLLESIRLRLEELSYSGVTGLSTYNEFYSESLLDSADQNRMSYLYGLNKLISYSPQFVAGLNYLVIPRMVKNSTQLINDSSLGNSSRIKEVLLLRRDDAKLLGGMSVFDISSSEINEAVYKTAFKEVIEEFKDQSSSLEEIASWKIKREGVRISLSLENGKRVISLENTNKQSVKNVKVFFDVGAERKEFMIKNMNAKEKLVIDSALYLER